MSKEKSSTTATMIVTAMNHTHILHGCLLSSVYYFFIQKNTSRQNKFSFALLFLHWVIAIKLKNISKSIVKRMYLKLVKVKSYTWIVTVSAGGGVGGWWKIWLHYAFDLERLKTII